MCILYRLICFYKNILSASLPGAQTNICVLSVDIAQINYFNLFKKILYILNIFIQYTKHIVTVVACLEKINTIRLLSKI